ncbi:hypothetical protein [Streptomyces olindensis]
MTFFDTADVYGDAAAAQPANGFAAQSFRVSPVDGQHNSATNVANLVAYP